MWQQRFGEKVDGVIALDPVVLSYLLRATAPSCCPTAPRRRPTTSWR